MSEERETVFAVFKNGEVDSLFYNEPQAEAQRRVLEMRWNMTRIEELPIYGKKTLSDKTRHFMPVGFYVHNSEPTKKMRLVSFDGSQGNFQISKNSKAVMIIGLGAVVHVDPPADYMEWNKVFEE